MRLGQSDFHCFDFDEWVTLAKEDPEAFERRRIELLQTAFEQASRRNRTRLEGLQFQLDMLRRKSSHPLGACIKISSMMLDSLYADLSMPESQSGGNQQETGGNKQQSGTVIPLNAAHARKRE